MRCPSCFNENTKVLDSRDVDDGGAIRRRRECEKCSFRFSTYEQVEILNLTVEKRDGSLEPYEREKIVVGLKKALEKRAMDAERFKRMLIAIERDVQLTARADRIPSERVGEIVMKHLRRADKVAFIRFASVYQSFDDIERFQEVLDIIESGRPLKKKKSELQPIS